MRINSQKLRIILKSLQKQQIKQWKSSSLKDIIRWIQWLS